MKRRMMIGAIVVIVILGLMAYFKPLSLDKVVGKGGDISIVLNTFTIEDGTPHIDSENYSAISPAQKDQFLALTQKYSYQRTLNTLFSDGGVTDIGDQTLSIYLFDEDCFHNVFITSSGKIVVDQKSYHMKGAETFIQETMAILEDKP